MSRSRKKTPVHGICTGDSQKDWKRDNNRRARRVVKHAIARDGEDLEPTELPVKREVSDVWDGPYDGKHYIKGLDKDDPLLRK